METEQPVRRGLGRKIALGTLGVVLLFAAGLAFPLMDLYFHPASPEMRLRILGIAAVLWPVALAVPVIIAIRRHRAGRLYSWATAGWLFLGANLLMILKASLDLAFDISRSVDNGFYVVAFPSMMGIGSVLMTLTTDKRPSLKKPLDRTP